MAGAGARGDPDCARATGAISKDNQMNLARLDIQDLTS